MVHAGIQIADELSDRKQPTTTEARRNAQVAAWLHHLDRVRGGPANDGESDGLASSSWFAAMSPGRAWRLFSE